MKLRNKRTGEIKDVESLGHEKSLRDKYGPQITLSWNTEYENLGECRTYNSLAELNEEWEDYEEPKGNWTIDPMNENYIDDGRYTAPDELERYEELEDKVNFEIQNYGFKPLGGVCGYENVSGRLLQAMIKDERTEGTKVINDFVNFFGGEE